MKHSGKVVSRVWLLAFVLLFSCGPSSAKPNDVQRLAKEIQVLQTEGKYQEALFKAQEWVEATRAEKGESSPDCATALSVLGALQMVLQNLHDAESTFRRAVGILEKAASAKNDKNQLLLAGLRSLLGLALAQDGDLIEAQSLLEAALEVQASLIGRRQEDTANTLNGLGIVKLQLGEFGESLKLLNESLGIFREKSGDNNPFTVIIRMEIGLVLVLEEKYSEAEAALKLAYEVLSQGPQFRPFVPKILLFQAMLARMRDDYGEAEKLLHRALDLQRNIYGRATTDDADMFSEMGNVAHGRFDNPAEERARRDALKIARDGYGPDDLRTVRYETELGGLLILQGDYAEASRLAEHARKIEDARLSPGSPFAVETLRLRSRLAEYEGNIVEAVALERKALDLLHRQHSGDHSEVADSMRRVGVLLVQQDDLANAAPFLEGAYQMGLRILPESDPKIVLGLVSLAMLYQSRGDLAQAEAMLRSAEAHAPANPRTARLLDALVKTYLAINFVKQENPTAALPLLQEAQPVMLGQFGADEAIRAETYRSGGALLFQLGLFAKAETSLRRAFEIYLRLRPHSADTARTAMALGITLLIRGDTESAEGVFRATLARVSQDRGMGILPSTLMAGLAATSLAKGNSSEAESLMQNALSAVAQSSEKSYSLLADFLYQLGNLRLRAGDRKQAEVFWERAVETAQREVGQNHPVVAYVLEARARLLLEGGPADKAQAATLAKQAVSILRQRFGEDHPLTADALGVQAEVEWTAGHIGAARSALEQRAHAEANSFTRELVLNDEAGYQSLLKGLSPTDLYVSFHWNADPADEAATRLAFEAILQRKGTLQDILAEHARLQHRPGKGRQLFARWTQAERTARSCGFARSPAGLTALSPGEHVACSEDLLALVAEAGRAYKALTDEVPGFHPRPIELADLAARLHALGDYALVEIVEYSSARPGTNETPKRYAAYILFPDRRIACVELGAQAVIDPIVSRLRALQSDPSSDLHEAQRTARELDKLVMQPVREKLGGQTKLFVAPDGDLNLVDVGSLVDEHGRELIEKYQIAGLTSGRDLLRIDDVATQSTAKKDYVFANPSFLAEVLPPNPQEATGAAPETLGSERPILTCEEAFKHNSWTAVNFDRYEDWKRALSPAAEYYTESKANKNTLLSIEKPRSVWLLTHGFFCGDSNGSADEISPTHSLWQDPMERSAIVLAGADASNPEVRRNGYVTASEIARLNWGGAALVVLGACETALGTPKVGDGVYGLRRALILAGVHTQVMTLWRVQGGQTFDILQTFVERLARGEDRLTALREARLLVRTNNNHPYFWAGIYFMGDPRPMPHD